MVLLNAHLFNTIQLVKCLLMSYTVLLVGLGVACGLRQMNGLIKCTCNMRESLHKKSLLLLATNQLQTAASQRRFASFLLASCCCCCLLALQVALPGSIDSIVIVAPRLLLLAGTSVSLLRRACCRCCLAGCCRRGCRCCLCPEPAATQALHVNALQLWQQRVHPLKPSRAHLRRETTQQAAAATGGMCNVAQHLDSQQGMCHCCEPSQGAALHIHSTPQSAQSRYSLPASCPALC